MTRQFDVIVIGGGLVGATAACLFAHHGFRVALAEARDLNPNPTPQAAKHNDPRVIAVHLAARNLFTALGIWQTIPPIARTPYHTMRVWDANSPAQITFSARDIAQIHLGYILENHALRNALLQNLHHHPQVTLLPQSKLTDLTPAENNKPGATITLNEQRLTADLIVGADGSDSPLRRLCNLTTATTDFAQDAIVANLTTTRPHQNTAWQCFTPAGPIALLPRAENHCALIYSCDRPHADKLISLSPAEFCAHLQEIFAAHLGDLTLQKPATRHRFPIRHHHAQTYIKNAVALIGDAAHTAHPLAGLGANLGFMDAAALAQIAAEARANHHHIAQRSVLRRYQRARYGENARALALIKSCQEIFASPTPTAKTARTLAMNLTDTLTPLKSKLAELANGLHADAPTLCR